MGVQVVQYGYRCMMGTALRGIMYLQSTLLALTFATAVYVQTDLVPQHPVYLHFICHLIIELYV